MREGGFDEKIYRDVHDRNALSADGMYGRQ